MNYDATSATSHSVWFPGIGAQNLTFEPGVGLFSLDLALGEATLSGTLTGNGLSFEINATATGLMDSNAALCATAKYENGATVNDCLTHWSIFTGGLTGTLVENGGNGREFDIDTFALNGTDPLPNPQLGTNHANAKNDNYGFSSWIGLELTSCTYCAGVPLNTRYKGDINIDLHAVSVPEPTVLGLFAAGLLGLGLARRRSRA